MPDFPNFDQWFPPVETPPRRPAPAFETRNLTDADFAALHGVVRDWRDERAACGGSLRTWFRHFGSTSWLAEATDDRRPLGILVGFRSVDRPGEAVIQLVAVDPAVRRRGIGRALVERFAAQQGAADGAPSADHAPSETAGRVTALSATCRPDDRGACAFFAALGFAPQAGPGSSPLYGVPAFADWDGAGEDRVLLIRSPAS